MDGSPPFEPFESVQWHGLAQSGTTDIVSAFAEAESVRDADSVPAAPPLPDQPPKIIDTKGPK
jgi:hypothetical protein